jgi:hypothetical protein
MQAPAAKLSGWRRKNSAALLREEFKNSLLAFMYLYLKKQALKWTRSVCLRAF